MGRTGQPVARLGDDLIGSRACGKCCRLGDNAGRTGFELRSGRWHSNAGDEISVGRAGRSELVATDRVAWRLTVGVELGVATARVGPIVTVVPLEFEQVEAIRDHDELVEFLCNDEWPFHGRRVLAPDDVAAMEFSSADVATYWIVDRHRPHRQVVGLVRLLDMSDIGEGAPLFDLRIAGRHRGCGLGTLATRWVVDHLFSAYPEMHRIEANTRDDNVAMQRVLSTAGFTGEGRLREAWGSDDGRWFDTMIYGILRTDWASTGASSSQSPV